MEGVIKSIIEQGNFIGLLIWPIIIDIAALGWVFGLGRMLGILKTDTPKNAAAICFIIAGHLYIRQVWQGFTGADLIFYVIIDSGFSYVIYVLFLWRLYSRVDNLLDRVFDEDKFKPTRRKKK